MNPLVLPSEAISSLQTTAAVLAATVVAAADSIFLVRSATAVTRNRKMRKKSGYFLLYGSCKRVRNDAQMEGFFRFVVDD